MSEKPKTLEEMIRVWEQTLPYEIPQKDRIVIGEAFFNGIMIGIGVVSNRMAEVQPKSTNVSDYLMELSQEISKLVSDIIRAELDFKGEEYGEG